MGPSGPPSAQAAPPRWASNHNPLAARNAAAAAAALAAAHVPAPPAPAFNRAQFVQSAVRPDSASPTPHTPVPGAVPAQHQRSRTEMEIDQRFNPDVIAEVITIKKQANNEFWDPVWVDRLTEYRNEVRDSDDVDDQFAFGRWVLEMGVNARWSDPEPSFAERNKDGLLREGSKTIKKLARGGLGKQPHPPAQFLLADYHASGKAEPYIEQSFSKAFALYVAITKSYKAPNSSSAGGKREIEMGVVAAQATFRAGQCCEEGWGTRKDAGRAVQFYRKAASLSDTHAMHRMGHLYIDGLLGVQRSPREGVSWMKRAAMQADESFADPLHDLAEVYEGIIDTSGAVVKDMAYAYTLYLRAAQIGYTKSQYHLGLAHEHGLLGLPIDARRSVAWYNLAAQAGNPEAMLGLSGWYITGAEGVLEQSDDLAYKWARSAAELELPQAECAVGFYIEHGVGAPPDMEKARAWYNLAADHGDRRAISRLKGLEREEETSWSGGAGSSNTVQRMKTVRDDAVRRRELARQGQWDEDDRY